MTNDQRPFRFAIQTGPFTDPVALRAFTRKLEDLGYAELYSYDHTTTTSTGDGSDPVSHLVDPFLPLLVAAEATTTLRFGPLVLNNEFHNPVLLARTAATFDALSDGRLILGMGTGYQQSEHDATGIPLRAPGPRVTRFGQSLAVLRALLDDGTAHLDVDDVTVAVEQLGVRPAQAHVPILVGGHGPRVVSLAGRYADIFQFTGLGHEPETGAPTAAGFHPDEVAMRHRWLAEAAGDRFGQLDISTLVQRTKIGDGADEARLEAATHTELDPSVVDATPFLLFGSTEQVIDKLHRLRQEFGINHVVSRDPDDLAPVVAALAGQ